MGRLPRVNFVNARNDGGLGFSLNGDCHALTLLMLAMTGTFGDCYAYGSQ